MKEGPQKVSFFFYLLVRTAGFSCALVALEIMMEAVGALEGCSGVR